MGAQVAHDPHIAGTHRGEQEVLNMSPEDLFRTTALVTLSGMK